MLVSCSSGDELKCKFEYFLSHYSCTVEGFVATNDHVKIEKITGQHLSGKTDADVENLYFEHQNVPYLPLGLDERFINLKSMSVINSSVAHINNEALKMINLIDLTFEYNDIKDVAENTFQNLRQLKSLNLASNHIAKLHLNTFKNMNELKTLNLNWNQLESLDAGVFNDCKNLQTLYLRQNKLSIIDKTILDPLEGLQYIYMQGNVCVDRNDYFDFTALKAEIASKCNDVCADRIKKLSEGYNLKFMELQKAIFHAHDKIEKLSAEVSENSATPQIPSPSMPLTSIDSEDDKETETVDENNGMEEVDPEETVDETGDYDNNGVEGGYGESVNLNTGIEEGDPETANLNTGMEGGDPETVNLNTGMEGGYPEIQITNEHGPTIIELSGIDNKDSTQNNDKGNADTYLSFKFNSK